MRDGMNEFHDLCALDELEDGKGRGFEIAKREVSGARCCAFDGTTVLLNQLGFGTLPHHVVIFIGCRV
jgi:hypothetical protein